MVILEYNLQDLFQSQFGYQPAELNIQDPDDGQNTAIIAPTGDVQTKELVNQKLMLETVAPTIAKMH